MDITDFTTEELRAELSRRNKEAHKLVQREKPKYIEWEATIGKVYDGRIFQRIYFTLKDATVPNIDFYDRFYLKGGVGFNRKNAPKVGDRVKLSYRNIKKLTRFDIGNSKIIEIIK